MNKYDDLYAREPYRNPRRYVWIWLVIGVVCFLVVRWLKQP